MRLGLRFDSLRETTPMEYAKRFVFGGLVTVIATLISKKFGPVVGGMFLAFPGIFPGGVSLVEKHKRLREMEAGKDGVRSARGEAGVEAAGASAGALGLVGFAVVLWRGLEAGYGLAWVLVVAGVVWGVVGWCCWWVRERV
jgi:hypothetical protein